MVAPMVSWDLLPICRFNDSWIYLAIRKINPAGSISPAIKSNINESRKPTCWTGLCRCKTNLDDAFV